MIQAYSCGGMEFYRNALLQMGFEEYCDPSSPALFLGTYFKSDVDAMARHKGPGYVFWSGTDVLHLGKHPDWVEVVKALPLKHAAHHRDLALEVQALLGLPVDASPTFFHDPMDYPVLFKPSLPHDYFMSTRKGRHREYGVPEALEAFDALDPAMFRLYVYGDRPGDPRPTNVEYCGEWPERVMDRACANMHGALRLNEHDGTSQIVIKSRLWGQWPVVHRKSEPGLLGKIVLSSAMTTPQPRGGLVLNKFIDDIRRKHA